MRTRQTIAGVMILCMGAVFPSRADKFISASIGPLWPHVLFDGDSKTAWNASVLAGNVIDKKVGFGMGIDFLWNVSDSAAEDIDGRTFVPKSESSFMFPVSAFFMLDPLPAMIVHPAAQFQIGYNSMVYVLKTDSGGTTGTRSDNGYYFGLYMKGALDAVYDIGEEAALFAGMFYQWADTRSFADKRGTFTPRNMGGFGLRAGFKAAY